MFGDVGILLSERHLRVRGQSVPIGARAYDVLKLLMANRDRVVTKKELLETVWPGLVVEENNLQVQISTLRKVLGRDAITTVPGLGYQFTAPAHGAGDASPHGVAPQPPSQEAAAVPSPSTPQPVPPRAAGASPRGTAQAAPAMIAPTRTEPLSLPSRWSALGYGPAWLVLGVALMLAGAIAARQLLWAQPQAPSPASVQDKPAVIPERSIAVLPFVDMSEKKNLEYFADGLSEQLLHLLSRESELRVAPRTSTFSFKDKSVDLPTIASKLRVANVLEGSVRRSGNDLRITAELVRADNGNRLWSQTYDRKLGDILQIQDELAAAMVQATHLSLLGETLPKSTDSKTAGAYTLYLQARSLLLHANTKADWELVSEYARRAISTDVTFAPAWAFFSRVLSTQARLGYIHGESEWEAARQTAVRSLALEPRLPEGHAALAAILVSHDRNWPAARTQIDAALKLDPGNALATEWAGNLALALGQKDRAVHYFERSIASEPLDPNKYNLLAHALALNGRFAEAQSVLHNALKLNSGQPFAHETLGRIALAKGDPATALAEFDHEPDEESRLVGRAIALHAQGRKADADATLAELEQKYGEYGAAYIAGVHAYRGEGEQALAWLERGYQRRNLDCATLKVEPLLENIRADPRFLALLRKVNLPVG